MSAVARLDRALPPTPPRGTPAPARGSAAPMRTSVMPPRAQATVARSAAAPTRSVGVPSRTATVATPAPRLRSVAAPVASRSLVPFVSLCISIIVASLVAVLILNTQMAEGAYETRDLRIQLVNLTEQRGEMLSTLEENAAPQYLAQRAQKLGMEPAHRVGFVSLEDGVVTGARGHR